MINKQRNKKKNRENQLNIYKKTFLSFFIIIDKNKKL